MTRTERNRIASQRRRLRRIAAGQCINGIRHPAPVSGVRCWLCVEGHRRRAEVTPIMSARTRLREADREHARELARKHSAAYRARKKHREAA